MVHFGSLKVKSAAAQVQRLSVFAKAAAEIAISAFGEIAVLTLSVDKIDQGGSDCLTILLSHAVAKGFGEPIAIYALQAPGVWCTLPNSTNKTTYGW